MPLSKRALSNADHRAAAVAVVPTQDRLLLATRDSRGVVMLWDLATGDPVGDGLPFLDRHRRTSGHGRHHTARRALRPGHRQQTDTPAGMGTGEQHPVQRIAVDVAVTCLATAGPDLIVGHDRGVLRLPLTRQ